MTRMYRNERGQAFAITAIALVALLGIGAFVMDVGAWFRADRELQRVADAAALAGAQELPDNPAGAVALAKSYATDNGGPAPTSVTVTTTKGTNDTIKVVMNEETPGFFSNVLGVDAVDIGAKATARAALPGKVRWIAPIVVNEKHPALNCGNGAFGKPKPCEGLNATLDYYNLSDKGPDAAGSFGFLDLTGENNGTSDLKNQLGNGFDQYIEVGNFSARTGNPFSAITTEIDQHIAAGDELLFPIYKQIIRNGTKATYVIVGFAAFVITGRDFTGSNEKLFGHFTGNVSWDSVEGTSGKPTDFGVRTIILSE
jgi:putative Flp pilus-assembly TadE/G-like protein